MPLAENPGALTKAQFDTAPRMADPASVREGGASYDQRADGEQPALTAEEEATLEASLRSLGYLE